MCTDWLAVFKSFYVLGEFCISSTFISLKPEMHFLCLLCSQFYGFSPTIKKYQFIGDLVQVVEYLPSKQKALSSVPSTPAHPAPHKKEVPILHSDSGKNGKVSGINYVKTDREASSCGDQQGQGRTLRQEEKTEYPEE